MMICRVEPILSTNKHPTSSIGHTVFLKVTKDPFMDPYIEAISRMDHAALMNIPQLDDEQFLLELAQDTDTISSKCE